MVINSIIIPIRAEYTKEIKVWEILLSYSFISRKIPLGVVANMHEVFLRPFFWNNPI